MLFQELKEYYAGRRVFVTGHTGFKGSWLTALLCMLGAEVYGYSLEPPTEPDLFSILGLGERMHSVIGDVRDFEKLSAAYAAADPEVVLHLAAQPIVRDSYRFPRETYEINVMGTVNLLECLRTHPGAGSFLNVTTDKVYENEDVPEHAFTEDEKLDGYDPYSNSKSCSELVTHAYRKSFFSPAGGTPGLDAAGGADRRPRVPAVSTARAGNVIGGGDFAHDRIIPDCVRDTIAGRAIRVRNPYSTRPYQHVLEPVSVYLMLAMRQDKEPGLAGYYNVGPDERDALTTGALADLFTEAWNRAEENGSAAAAGGDRTGQTARWESLAEPNAPHEANYLRLDSGKLRRTFGWTPRWHAEEAVRETVGWYRAWHEGQEMQAYTERQIHSFFE